MKILVAPLDWGLGHATRCVPIIREFLRQGAEVELATVKSNSFLLKNIFPNLRQRIAPSYNIVYPKHGYNMGLWLLKNGIHLRTVCNYEHRYAEAMVQRHHYDILFSDNRFGFFSKNAKSIYMTHQRRIAFPPMFSALEGIGVMWHNLVMKHFDEVWVPDLKEFPGYAGELSHVNISAVPTKFIGPLSRFKSSKPCQKKYKFVAVVSGVEPARSMFEKKLTEALKNISGEHAIILGKPTSGFKSYKKNNIEFFTHLPDDKFANLINAAEWIISRGGYSTIMDMAVLKAKCIFVPTPGQYEQIVLAKDLSQNSAALTLKEHQLTAENLQKITVENSPINLPEPTDSELLKNAVQQILKG